MRYFDFAPTTTDRKDFTDYKSIAFIQNFSSLDILEETTVEAEEQFRPDKISYRLYNTVELDWVLAGDGDCGLVAGRDAGEGERRGGWVNLWG